MPDLLLLSMKLSAFILLVFCLPFSGWAQHAKNDLERQRLKGSIGTITEYERDAKSNDVITKNISKYDSRGDQLDLYSYDKDNALLSKSLFTYNDSGRLIDIKRYKGDGTLNVRTTCKYDARGFQIEEDNYDGSGMLFMKSVYTFNGNGTPRVLDRFNEFGILFLKSNFKYDDDHNEIEEKQYDSHHGLKFSITYDYDGFDVNGNWTKRTMNKNDDPAIVIEREFSAQ